MSVCSCVYGTATGIGLQLLVRVRLMRRGEEVTCKNASGLECVNCERESVYVRCGN